MVCGAQGYCQGDMAGLDSGPWWNCTLCSLEEPDSLIDNHSMLRDNKLRRVQAASTGSYTIQSTILFLHINPIQHVIIVTKKKSDDKKFPFLSSHTYTPDRIDPDRLYLGPRGKQSKDRKQQTKYISTGQKTNCQ
jgi:hypothetical protein